MKSWILLFVFVLAFTDLLIWLDQGINLQFMSLLYINLLLVLSFIVFFSWRYYVEMRFTKQLTTLVHEEDVHWQEALPKATFSRDAVARDALLHTAESFAQQIAVLNSSNMIKSDYTAAWVHEVKTPLTAMKLVLDAQRHDPVIRKIEAEWLRVYLLIDQQLYISRLASLETDYVLEKTAVQQLVTAEVRELTSWCIEKNVAVEFEGDEIEVVTDQKWCRFMIRQLLTNAVKYSPLSGTITISSRILPSGHPILTIADEGPGIHAHDLPRIFDKGFTGGTGRIHNAATGLGLYLAQTVATRIGITLTVQSEIAQGTTLHMTFSIENDFVKTLT